MPIIKTFSKSTPEEVKNAQLGQNFQEIDNKFTTNIVKDTSGNKRIIFGKLPDGTYGLVISKEGVDVTTLF